LEDVKAELKRELNEKRKLREKVVELILGKREDDVCPLCGETKTLLLLKEDIITCQECLNTLLSILKAAGKPIQKKKLLATLKLQNLIRG